jgi:hypothetical protein
VTIKVIVRRRVDLSDTQVELLRFLADKQAAPPPRRQSGTYEALETNGLIRRERTRARYRITDVGADVLAQVEGVVT